MRSRASSSVFCSTAGKRRWRSLQDAGLDLGALEDLAEDEQDEEGEREQRQDQVVGDHRRQPGDVLAVGAVPEGAQVAREPRAGRRRAPRVNRASVARRRASRPSARGSLRRTPSVAASAATATPAQASVLEPRAALRRPPCRGASALGSRRGSRGGGAGSGRGGALRRVAAAPGGPAARRLRASRRAGLAARRAAPSARRRRSSARPAAARRHSFARGARVSAGSRSTSLTGAPIPASPRRDGAACRDVDRVHETATFSARTARMPRSLASERHWPVPSGARPLRTRIGRARPKLRYEMAEAHHRYRRRRKTRASEC